MILKYVDDLINESVALDIAKQFGKGALNSINPKFMYHAFKGNIDDHLIYGKAHPGLHEMHANLAGNLTGAAATTIPMFFPPNLSHDTK